MLSPLSTMLEGAASPGLLRTGVLIDVDRQEGTTVLRLQGELDMATARELQAALAPVMAEEHTGIVLDLAQLSFIDSTGISVFLAACHQAECAGRSFSLRRPGRMVRKALHLTGVDRLLVIEPAESVTV